MKKVVVFCGGVSCEHEVSIRSARNIIDAIDKQKFIPILITISRAGTWYLHSDLSILEKINECKEPFAYGKVCTLIRRQNETFVLSVDGEQVKVDAAFPIIHGPMGEDGTIQGMFEIMNLPYVGSGVLSSSVGMDKSFAKIILNSANIPVVPFVCIDNYDDYVTYDDAARFLDSEILFVKPAIMGSSVGVSKVYSAKTYDAAIKQAFKYSSKVLVEKFIKCREIECAVLGNKSLKASTAGEIKPNHDFYSYEAKYIDPNGADLMIPANLPAEVSAEILSLAVKASQAIECRGLARVDFFLTADNAIFVNEINTLPGFTSISMYPKLWEFSGIGYSELITTLIDLAFEVHQQKQAICLMPEVLESCITYA